MIFFIYYLIARTILLIFIYADKTALNFLSKLTNKEYKLSEEPDSRDYKEELLVMKDILLKTRKGNIVFSILLFIYIYPFGYYGYERYHAYKTEQERILEEQANWSEFIGNMSYDEANEKCNSLGMKLPTREDLKAAYDTEITRSWLKDGNIYWSSTPYAAGRYYRLDIREGYVSDNNHYDNFNVRCYR